MTTPSSERQHRVTVYMDDDEAQALELLRARDDRSASYYMAQLFRERMAQELGYLQSAGSTAGSTRP